jgi:fructokinase
MADIDVIAIGELLIDFTPCEKGEIAYPVFEMNPGGAPVNCLAALNKLGAKTDFIGKVGCDSFGSFLKNVLLKEGIGINGLTCIEKTHTTIAFVFLNENGEREFSFLRDPGADTQLQKSDIELSLINRSRVVHFGSLSFTDNPAREATLYALNHARQLGKIISYDPNYRPLLWRDKDTALYWIKKGLEYADIVKMSEEEMELITGICDLKTGAQAIWNFGAKKVFITQGNKGAFYYASGTENGFVPAFSVCASDTTGCGDAFMGAILYQLLYEQNKPVYQMVEYANAVGALCATKRGGLPAMPEKGNIQRMISK